ncbi:MAG: stage III sporulation protein AF [Tissierellales bacterium]
MIDFVKSWVTNIVVVIFFIAFIENLLPSSNMRKYINTTLGLLIIIVLINPIIKLMSSDINIDREVFYNLQRYNTFNIEGESKYVESQNQQITKAYKGKIEKEISGFLRKDLEYGVLDVNVSINEDIAAEEFGEILGIEVYLGTKNNNEDQKSIKIDEIEEVAIEIKKSNLSIDHKERVPEFDGIIDSISSYYKVSKEKILIKVND